MKSDSEALLEHVKRTLQDIPNEGMDYFALRHIVPELHPETVPFIDGSRMLFHYQSEETAWQADDLYEPLPLPFGNTNAPDNPSAYWLNMTACLKRDRLSLTCYYSTLHYEKQTVAGLVHRFATYLRQGIEVPLLTNTIYPLNVILHSRCDFFNTSGKFLFSLACTINEKKDMTAIPTASQATGVNPPPSYSVPIA